MRPVAFATCDQCRTTYHPARPWQRFCSPECRKKYWHENYEEEWMIRKLAQKSESERRDFLRELMRTVSDADSGRLRVRWRR